MMYPEVLDSLEELTNEEIGIMIRLICKWNKGEEVKPNGSLEKYVWSTIHPKLESNKESYQNIIDRNRVNGKKGGRPKTQDNPMGFSGNPNNPNYNSNSIIKIL